MTDDVDDHRPDGIDDHTLLEATVVDIITALADVLAQAWRVSPSCTVLALARVLCHLAVTHVHEHPGQREGILTTLRSLLAIVEAESMTKH